MICERRAIAPVATLPSNTQSKVQTVSCQRLSRYQGLKVLPHVKSPKIEASSTSAVRSRVGGQPAIVCSKVAVLGAAGGIGQPLSLLMKMNNMVTDLALYDIANVAGVAADLSHCNTPVNVCCFYPFARVWTFTDQRQ